MDRLMNGRMEVVLPLPLFLVLIAASTHDDDDDADDDGSNGRSGDGVMCTCLVNRQIDASLFRDSVCECMAL